MRCVVRVLVLALSVQAALLAVNQSTAYPSLAQTNDDDKAQLATKTFSLDELLEALKILEKPEENPQLILEITRHIEKDPAIAFDQRLENLPNEIKEAILQKFYPFRFFTKKHDFACSHVHCTAWSHDSKHVIYGAQHGVVTMRNPESGDCEKLIFGHDDEIKAVACSLDGKHFASGSRDKTIQICTMEGDPQKSLIGHTKSVISIDWSGDSAFLASGSRDKSIRIWNGEKGVLHKQLMGHTGTVTSVDWEPHGTRLASASTDGTVRIWQTDTGKEIMILKGHCVAQPWMSCAVRSVAWSPDGTMLASGSDDRSIIIWDARSGKHLKKFNGHTEAVRSVSWSPDGNYLASASFDKTVKVWDVKTGIPLQNLKKEALFDSVAWSPDGIFLASGDDEATLWERYTPTMGQLGVLLKIKQHKDLSEDEQKIYEELPQEMKDIFPVQLRESFDMKSA